MRTPAGSLLATILVPVMAIGVTAAIGTPAQAYEVDHLVASNWAYTDVSAPTSAFIGQEIDTPIGAWRDADNKFHSSRMYFSFDLTRLAGKKVTQAELGLQERSVKDCTLATPVELWRTGPITNAMSWVKPPRPLERLATLSLGAPAFCPGFFEVDLAAVITAALARGETQVTLGLHVRLDKEFLERHGRRMANRPLLRFTANTVPTIGEVGFEFRQPTCGTPDNPTFIRGIVTFRAVVNDPDRFDIVDGQFALWPVDAPQQRVEFSGGRYHPNVAKADRSVEEYDHGTRLAWAARGYDGHDYSAWSAPCYATIDKEPPANPPVVSSPEYPEGWTATGGPGIPGTFTFDAQGDPAVVAYEWDDNSGGYRRVDAPAPGAPATMTFTPTYSGPFFLRVRSVDRAFNRGPEYEYIFNVRDTAPQMRIEVGGVGVPGRITMSTHLPEITGFGYQIGDGPEVRFPAVEGTASASLTFAAAGSFEVTGRSYIGDTVIGTVRDSVFVDDVPTVESEDFGYPNYGVLGRPGTFTFRPRSLNVVAYQYSFGGDELATIAAGTDGVAVLTWTPVEPVQAPLYVMAEAADGSVSDFATFYFTVHDPRPRVSSSPLEFEPRRDGVGLPLAFEIASSMPDVTEHIYSIDDGPEQTVARVDYPTYVLWTPPTAGDHVFHARSRFADGTLSPVRDWPFRIWTGPIVQSSVYPPGGGGQPGQQGTFTVTPGLPGVVDYRVTFPEGAEQVIPADADGGAAFTYTPTSPGLTTITVVSRHADGTESDPRQYRFDVRDPRVLVNSFYFAHFARGGVGIGGHTTLHTQMYGSITEWIYWVNDGPARSIPVEPVPTSFTLVPERSGANVLYIRYRMTDGELSPVTEYPFLVGTAPVISSTDYPRDVWSGGPGVAGQFRFSGGTAGIVEYVYRVEAVLGGVSEEVTVPAVDGVAVATFAPETYFVHYMYVRGKLADGTLTDESVYNFIVQQAAAPTWGVFA